MTFCERSCCRIPVSQHAASRACEQQGSVTAAKSKSRRRQLLAPIMPRSRGDGRPLQGAQPVSFMRSQHMAPMPDTIAAASQRPCCRQATAGRA